LKTEERSKIPENLKNGMGIFSRVVEIILIEERLLPVGDSNLSFFGFLQIIWITVKKNQKKLQWPNP
jgi:hypothetical protein